MPTEAGALLELADLHKLFGGVVALAGVSLQVQAGVTMGLIGPNGAGKTTLFNVISGLYRPNSGLIRLQGRDITHLQQDRVAAHGVARTFQNLQIFRQMSVLENALAGAHQHGHCGLLSTMLRLPAARREERALRAAAMETLRFVGIERLAEASAATLPPGQQRLVEIARALAARPRLLLLDEPAAGLTTRETEVLGQLVRRIAETGLTTVLIEHDMSLVMDVCTEVAVLNQGRLLAVGSPSAIQADPHVISAYLGEEGSA